MTSATDYQGNSTFLGDATFGVARPNYLTNLGVETVTSNMEFISISTGVDIRTYAQNITAGNTVNQATQSQLNLNKLIEIVSLRGQPIIIGNVVTSHSNAYFTITFVTEHVGAWANTIANAQISSTAITTLEGITPAVYDTRTGEDLLSRLLADGINYGFGSASIATTSGTINDTPSSGANGGLTVTFNNPQVLT
jgi:hypothetical protein